MKGAALSLHARGELRQVIKARLLSVFAKNAGVNVATLKKLAGGGYTNADIVSRVEVAFSPDTTAERVVSLVADSLAVERSAITSPTSPGHRRYFRAELPALLKAKWIACFLIYREVPNISQRQVAQHVGYSDHKWVADICKRVFDLMDTEPDFRRLVLGIQRQLT